MKPSAAHMGAGVSGVLLLISFALFPWVPDPVSVPDTVTAEDERRHRWGDRTYAQTAAVIAALETEAGDLRSAEAEQALVTLVRIYRERRMIREAVEWLMKGLARFPDSPTLQDEERLLTEIVEMERQNWGPIGNW